MFLNPLALYVRRLRFGPVALRLVTGHASPALLVPAVESYVTDRRSGSAPPLFVARLGLSQQLGTGQRDDDRARRSGQYDGYDAHHHDDLGVFDVLLVANRRSSFEYGGTQSGLERIRLVTIIVN